MTVPSCCIEPCSLASRLIPDVFDDMDLTEASNRTKSHQNECPAVPHGFSDAAQLIDRSSFLKLSYSFSPPINTITRSENEQHAY
jgi:hypothetical protein